MTLSNETLCSSVLTGPEKGCDTCVPKGWICCDDGEGIRYSEVQTSMMERISGTLQSRPRWKFKSFDLEIEPDLQFRSSLRNQEIPSRFSGKGMDFDPFCRYPSACCAEKFCASQCLRPGGRVCGDLVAPAGYQCCDSTTEGQTVWTTGS